MIMYFVVSVVINSCKLQVFCSLQWLVVHIILYVGTTCSMCCNEYLQSLDMFLSTAPIYNMYIILVIYLSTKANICVQMFKLSPEKVFC